ncbi:hypothetical protein BHE97_00385 [Aeromicrobium sp. PE09-221]|uniref:tyrosine-protein phosphatase n=1 Tax=Aeromicrobium sp. PE09-221 TaxID=1898043 RepID=UPI000B68E128|nr:tyrosine-protein phosphatase [Aeromicrobium sp. PE09-221]OUZ12853.1 hypothetical protein BHE97_00385 [Aeromicrobium sp. PE09-221]
MSEFVPNLRDIGGMVAADGVLRTGRLLRSALPQADDRVPEGVTWPPRVVLDLRSAGEVEPQHPLAHTGARVLSFPLLSALRPGVTPPGSLAELYLLMLRTSAPYLVEVIDEIASAEGPTLVHCAAGKDRTGVSVALALSLLGVRRDDIVEDYLVTAQHEDEIEARFRRVLGPRRAEIPAAYFATPVEAIAAVLDSWESHDDGVHGWFRAAGGDVSAVDRLRERLVG